MTYEVLSEISLGLQARGINEDGWVVGREWVSYPRSPQFARAILWIPRAIRGTTGDTTHLQVLAPGQDAGAGAVNDAGQVVGYSATTDGTNHAVLWESGALHELGQECCAMAVTNPVPGQEQLVGGSDDVGTGRAVVWRVSGTGPGFQVVGRDLLPGLNGVGGQVYAVNESGVAVGRQWDGNPVRWDPSGGGWTVTALSLPGGATRGYAFGINSAGTIVGGWDSGTCPFGIQGLVWTPGKASPQTLPDLAGGTCSGAYAINDFGQIAGEAHDTQGGPGNYFLRPVLWVPDGSGGYSVLRLGLGGLPRALNEPRRDPSGVQVVQVVGEAGLNGLLWTVKVP